MIKLKAFHIFHSRKALRMLALSYILFMLCSLVIASVNYSRLIDNVKNHTLNMAESKLKQAAHTIDGYLDSVRLTLITIVSNEQVETLSYLSAPLNENVYYRMIKVHQLLNNYSAFNSALSEIAIYVKALDSIVYTSSRRSTEDFYRAFLDYEGTTYEEWVDDLSSYVYFRAQPAMYARAAGKTYLQYQVSIPIGANRGALFALINTSLFEDVFKSGGMLSGNAIRILDDGRQILSLGEKTEWWSECDGTCWKTVGGRSVLFATHTSDNGLVYQIMLPEDSYTSEISATKSYIMRMITIEIIGGLLLSLIMIYLNYTPLKKLLTKIGIKNQNSLKTASEYDHILFAASRMLTQNEQLAQQLQKQLPLLKKSLLSQIITTDAKMNRDSLMQYGLTFEGKYFTVAALYVNADQESRAVIRYSVTSLIENRFSQKSPIYVTECSPELIAILINLNADESAEIFAEIVRCLKSEMELEPILGVGSAVSLLEDIHHSYAEATEAVHYARAWKQYGIISYAEITCFSQNYVFTQATEQSLIEQLRAGASEKAAALIRRLFEDAAAEPIQHIQIMTYGVITTCLRLLCEWKLNSALIEKSVSQLTSYIIGNDPPDKLMTETLALIESVANTATEMKNANTTGIGAQALKLLEEHFTEDDFSLTSCAEMMSLSPPYLSHVFKQQTGESFINALNRIRLENASKLLRSTDLPVSVISKMCGYTDAGYFNRVFKKKFEITPGQHREEKR